jgi:hypothetical protein
VWDETNRVLSLLVPSEALREGVHTLSIRSTGHELGASFRVGRP